jgi:DNA polymerase I-like protein with 3'-5' exonuclease and polymerase domains
MSNYGYFRNMSDIPEIIVSPFPPLVLNPPLNVTFIQSLFDLPKVLTFLEKPVYGWDIETNPLKDFYYRRCRTVQFGNGTEQYVVDLLGLCDGDPELLFNSQGEYGKKLTGKLKEFIDCIAPYLISQAHMKVGVQLSFEYMMFYWLFGIRSAGFFDCSLVEKSIYAGAHSLKDYGFFSMEEMMQRYFGVQIDKTLQESFTLDGELTLPQIEYAALDTRLPLGIKVYQERILTGKVISQVDRMVCGDDLQDVAKIENDAIGAFQDMHIHGERIDRLAWRSRVDLKVQEYRDLIKDVFDPFFLPIVGSKSEGVTDEKIAEATAKWKAYNNVSDSELFLKAQARKVKKTDPVLSASYEADIERLVAARKAEKESHKLVASTMSKRRTVINRLAGKCEGDALINYSSDSQLLKVLKEIRGMTTLECLDDEALEGHSHIPIIAAIRKYHGLAKVIGTYGYSWVTEWVTHPCKEEGWLNPGDGKLHCTFNQFEAETGRSSSEKPNGQNLPQDKEVRSCFIVDPPDEDEPDGYVMVTADMSGAELRIIAELADDPVWIGAFSRKEDVHSVGTELLYEEEWPKMALPDCAYFKLKPDATPFRKKCKCPEHNALRDDNKSTNFLLAYGGGPGTLAKRIKKALDVARDLMARHEAKFPKIWAYLEESGQKAKRFGRAFDIFGGRRIFPQPTRERALERAKEYKEEALRYEDDVIEAAINSFTALTGRKPDREEKWHLEHRMPTDREVSASLVGMSEGIGRQGKNHCIQGSNARIAKLAMGCGHSPDGKPYLWHTLPQYKAKLLKFVHDELVVQCPKRFGTIVADLIGDAFKRAAAERMKKVEMEFEYNIAGYWKK